MDAAVSPGSRGRGAAVILRVPAGPTGPPGDRDQPDSFSLKKAMVRDQASSAAGLS